MKNNSLIKNALLIWAVWTVLGVIYTTKVFVYKLLRFSEASWTEAAYLQFSSAWLWAVITPIILLLTKWVPIKRSNLIISIPTHLLFSIIIGPIHSFASIWLDMSFRKLTGNIVDENPLEIVLGLSRITVSESFDSLAIYWIIMIVIYSINHYRNLRANRLKLINMEKQLAEAKYEALKMQLQPHFLFNTLNTISTLVHIDPKKADIMINKLSELLRISLDSMDQHKISLREEISFIKKYLEIQTVRYEERLKYQINIEPEAYDVMVPTFILQPIVENAIKHAVEPASNPIEITLTGIINGNNLHLEVSDNGPGFKQTPNKGLGIRNTEERLMQLYENNHKFELMNNGKGVKVTIEIPIQQS